MTEHCITQQAQFITQFTIINNELHFTFKTHFPNASLFSLQPHMLKHLQHIYCNNHIQLCMDTTLLVHFRFTCVSLTTSMIPSSNRIQNGDILVQANPREPRQEAQLTLTTRSTLTRPCRISDGLTAHTTLTKAIKYSNI